MSLPEFKFTNLTKPTNDTTVNIGLSAKDKMVKSGIVPKMVEKVQDTASSAWSGISNAGSSVIGNLETSLDSGDGDGDGSGSFFSFTFLIKFILIVVILWFMWTNLANHGDFHLGMAQITDKITAFFKKMEDKGRELISKITGNKESESESESDDDDDDDKDTTATAAATAAATAGGGKHRAPVPPPMNNSSDKKPGFNNDDSKYTFLDKAVRDYSGPSPSADDSTSVTQKHQSGKAGYCYIGEDRGFRTCARVEAGDKCMSGQVYSRQEICIDPTLRD
jgi:hypothetical protein